MKGVLKAITNAFRGFWNDMKDIGTTFAYGDWKTRVSYVIMGFGSIARKQFLKGFLFLTFEIAYIGYMIIGGAGYLAKFDNLGDAAMIENPDGTVAYGDNSFLILLFGLLTILFTVLFIVVWRINLRENRKAQELLAKGKKLPAAKDDLKSLMDGNFHKTLLTLPIAGICIFTILPIIFMVCVAFTNFDATHQAPSNLFTWVGFKNFKTMLSFGGDGIGSTFVTVLGWTLVWAFFATFLNYFLGMGLAMLINKKGIKFKKLWRTIFVITIAVPQFVSLLYVSKLFAADGLINTYFLKWGLIEKALPFWTNATWAKFTIIGINLWIGIPYLMLIATGLLMNIPEDLYESARIDGANKLQMFRKITLPYMLFVTGPYLLTSFTGNLNNFNVIYLLSGGGPTSMELSNPAGSTDLLITWLYKLTVSETDYKLAAVIGILVFVVTAVISVVVYNMLPSVKDEEGFQ